MILQISITATILLLMGMACVSMGLILKNTVITVCGLVGGIISPIVALMNAGRRPRTTCRITQEGIAAFEEYVKALQSYLTPRKQ